MEDHGSLSRIQNGRRRQRGFALILTALMLTMILPMVGLVIDVGIMYAVRARLTMACDAAALAAARSLAVGVTLADQEATATARAQAFYNANFPVGTLETNDGHVTVTVDESVTQVRTVTVTGSAAAPVYFMQMLGVPRTHVSATGSASRRDVNVMMVLDRSGSLQAAGACDDLEVAATAFTGLFANQRDRMGMITFGGAYRLDYPPTRNFKQSPKLTDEIGKLYPGGCSGWTGSAQALWQGYTQLVNINEPGAFNVIVFFTDGQPNTVTAEFNVKTQSTPESSTFSRCYDWEHDVKYTSSAWNPTTQKYLGTIAGGTWIDGLYKPDAAAMPVSEERVAVTNPVGYSGSPKSSSDDCRYRGYSPYTVYDIAYYPDQDLYGNSMSGYKTVDKYTSGHPYAGKVKITASNIESAAVNAVDNAAKRIRDKVLHPTMPITTYVVGLGGAGAAEHELLKRIANTKESNAYDAAAPTGLYLYAPTSAQLSMAFSQIGSEILRLSK